MYRTPLQRLLAENMAAEKAARDFGPYVWANPAEPDLQYSASEKLVARADHRPSASADRHPLAARPVAVTGSTSRPWLGRETPVLPVKRAPIVVVGGAASTLETTAKFRLKRLAVTTAAVVGRHSTCGFGCETWAVRDGAGLRYFIWHSADFECPLSAHAPTAQETITVTPGPTGRVQVRVTRKVRKVKF